MEDCTVLIKQSFLQEKKKKSVQKHLLFDAGNICDICAWISVLLHKSLIDETVLLGSEGHSRWEAAEPEGARRKLPHRVLGRTALYLLLFSLHQPQLFCLRGCCFH